MGLEKTRHIHKILIDPTDPNTVYVGAIGSPWGAHEERGCTKLPMVVKVGREFSLAIQPLE